MTQSEQIIGIRAWANERAVPATAHNEEYNYSDDNKDLEKKEKQKTETIKRNRGGRTIDF